MKCIVGKKIGMTQVFLKDGQVVPVTRVAAGPCPVVAVKDGKKDNAMAVQLGYGSKKESRISNSVKGHLKGLSLVEGMMDFEQEKIDGITRGDMVTVSTFAVGDVVEVVGTSKGKGFAGVVKRHHFKGAPKSHGHKHDLRAPGSIGAGGVQRVFKGMRMAGRMGGERVTVLNLTVHAVDAEKGLLLVKGAVPGPRGSVVLVRNAVKGA